MKLKKAIDRLFIGLWINLMIAISLAIYKYAFWDTLASWDYANWQAIDWFIYVAVVSFYGTFWALLALYIPYEVNKRNGNKG